MLFTLIQDRSGTVSALAIMHQALKVALQEHHTAIRLESTLNAIGFYERFGFREVERSSVIRRQVAVPL